jgi:hypothetical protein
MLGESMKLSMANTRSLGSALVFFGLSALFCLTTMHAQAPTPAQKQATGTGAVNLTATSANVSESGTAVRINILRWSTDAERNPLVAAMNPPAPAPAPAAAAAGERGGAAQAGRGGAAQAGRGGAARGGRGGRGDAAAPSAPADPIVTLTAAIDKAPTVGYIWTNEVVGYSIKYAYHASLPDGGERIILATNRRLGANTTAWKPAPPSTPTDYEFTLIEMRLDSKGLGEGKTSLTTKVIVDNEARTVALDNYGATPAILRNVKR